MKFEYFIRVPKPFAMVITVEEYKRIKPFLQEFYSEKDFAHIDDFCQFKPPFERFLLCNPHEKAQIRTPMMYLNAVTFIDRVPFKNIVLPGQEAQTMKEWKDGKNRYELLLNGQKACVLYYDKEYGYYSRAYLDGGSDESALPANNLAEAKQAAEKWYGECLGKSIETHKLCISDHEKKLEQLEG